MATFKGSVEGVRRFIDGLMKARRLALDEFVDAGVSAEDVAYNTAILDVCDAIDAAIASTPREP